MTTIDTTPDDPHAVDLVLERFLAARLLTAHADTIEISHDALLTAWPHLAGWVDADRAGLRIHQQLVDAAHAWGAAKKDDALLWHGTPLETAIEWASEQEHERALNQSEREFLSSAVAHRDAQLRTARRRTRRMKQLLGLACALAVATSALAVSALDARSSADQARNQALSRQVAIEAQQLRPADPALAGQLAVAAYRISPTLQARSTLIEATGGELPTRLLGPVGPEFLAEAHTLLAVAQSATDTVEIYAMHNGRPRSTSQIRVGPTTGEDFAVALTPNGRLLAAGDTAGDVTLWSVENPAHPERVATLDGTSTVYSVAFNAGGEQLAAAYDDGTVGQWDVADPRHPNAEPTVDVPGAPTMKAVAFDPGGNLVAAGGADGTLVTWTPGTNAVTTVAHAGSDTLGAIAFSPNGTTLAAGSDDSDIYLWTITTGVQPVPARSPLSPGSAYVTCLSFSPGGSALAACSDTGTIVVYDTKTWVTEASFPVPNPPTGVVFSSEGTTLATADAGGVTRLWHLPTPASYQTGGNVFDLQYSASGEELVAVSAGTAGDVTVWDARSPLRPTDVGAVSMPARFGPVAGAGTLSPNGRLLAVADATARIQLLDVADPLRPKPIGAPLRGSHPLIEQMAFTPNGKVLVAGDDSGQLRLWDVADPAHPQLLASLKDTRGEVLGVTTSDNGKLLAAASTDTKVRLWSIVDPGHPRLLATLGGFASYAYDAVFTPNGTTLVAASAGGDLRLWNVTDPGHPKLLAQTQSGLTGDIYQIAVSPDGQTLAAVTTDHMVGIWGIANPTSPVLEATLNTGSGTLFSVAFDPLSPVLVASGSDQTLYLWDYKATHDVRLICSATGASLTRSEWREYIQGAPYDAPCAK